MIYRKPDPTVNSSALNGAIKIVEFRYGNLFKRGMQRSFSDACVIAWDIGPDMQPIEIVTNALTALSLGLQSLHILGLESIAEDIVEAVNNEQLTMTDRSLALIGPQFEFLHNSFQSITADPHNVNHQLVFAKSLQSLMLRELQEEYGRLAPGHDQSIYSMDGDTELLQGMSQAALSISQNIADNLNA